MFYDNPALSLDRILRTLVVAGSDGLPAWIRSAPSWLSGNLFVQRLIREEAPSIFLFTQHDILAVSKKVEYQARGDEWLWLFDAKPKS